MKKVLSIIMVLAMLAMSASITVFAEDALGSYNNPYRLQADSLQPLKLSVSADGGEAYVFVDDANNSTVTIGYLSANGCQVYYCKQPVAAQDDGTFVFKMVEGAGYFTIINPTSSAINVSIRLASDDGSGATFGTVDNPEILTFSKDFIGNTVASDEAALVSGNEGYYYSVTAPDDGILAVSITADDVDNNPIHFMYFVNNLTSYQYGDSNYSTDDTFENYVELSVKKGDELQIFAATYNPQSQWNNPAGTVKVNATFNAKGSWLCPEATTTGAHTATIESASNGYYYTWTASNSGTVTFEMDASNAAWTYNLYCERTDGSATYGDTRWSDDETVVYTASFDVAAGDVLHINVNTYNPTGVNPAGNIAWSLTFVNGDGYIEDDSNNDNNDDSDDNGSEEIVEANWILSDKFIVTGAGSYDVDASYAYTVYSFEPSEIGKYTFTSSNANIALVSTNGMWINVGPSTDIISADIVSSNAFEWTCTAVGQTIWVAAVSETNTADITVNYEEIVIKEIPKVYYENTVTPEMFVYNGSDSIFDNYVDTFDGIEDVAVLGTDGYYHLNAADGPILFANINDPLMSLTLANDYGQLKQIIYDENGEVVEILDFTLAMIDYIACKDEATGLYPLTADLIAVFSKAGTSLGWYGADGWIGGEEADCWMFACYYDVNIVDGSDLGITPPATPPTSDNNDADNGVNNDAAGNEDNTVHSPATGDAVTVAAVVAIIALCAFVVVLRSKRRSFN